MTVARQGEDNLSISTREVCRGPSCSCLGLLYGLVSKENGAPGRDRESGAALLYIRRLKYDGPQPPMIAASFCPLCGDAYT